MLIAVKTEPETLVASAEQMALAEEYRSLTSMRDDLAAEIKKVQAALIASLGGVPGRKVTKPNGTPLVTYSAKASSGKFDRDAFKAAHPQIFNRFWTPGVPGAGTPQLTVTTCKELP